MITTLGEISNLQRGTRFYRCDLHVHTPESTCFNKNERAITPAELVKGIVKKGLEIIAVTDHNSIGWCDKVQKAAEDAGLIVFPGVEISTHEGHVLALFDPTAELSVIDTLLTQIGIPPDKRGQDDAYADTVDIIELFKRIEVAGGVAIAAHVDGEGGFMKMIRHGARKKKVYAHPCLRGLEIIDPTQREKYLAGKTGYEKPRASIQCSDSLETGSSTHSLDGIGKRYCYLKMDEIGIEGLKQALYDPEVRIKFQGELDPPKYPELVGLSINNGFFKGLQCWFNPDLNCFIGGTGVGKSLAIEAIRYAMGQQSQLPKIMSETKSMLSKALGEHTKVSLLLQKGETYYVLERLYAQPNADSVLFRVTSERLEEAGKIGDLESFFKVKSFSQSEIIEIAREPAARIPLIDDLIDIDLEKSGIIEKKEELRQNAELLITAKTEIERIEVGLDKLGEIQEEIKRLQEILSDKKLKEHQKWHDEEQFINDTKLALDTIRSDSIEAIEIIDVKSPFPDLVSDGPNKKVLSDFVTIPDDIAKLMIQTSKSIQEAIDEKKKVVEAVELKWRDLFDKEEKENKKLLAKLDTEDQGFELMEERIKTLRRKEKSLLAKQELLKTKLKPALEKLIKKRDKLLTDMQIDRKAIHEKREKKAAELTAKLESRVRIRISQNKNRETYYSRLESLLEGSRMRDTDIKNVCDRIHPIVLAKLLTDENSAEIAKVGDIAEKWAEVMIRYLLDTKGLREILNLQLQDIEDVVEISFRVDEGRYKDISELSHGQKCTVILMIAMAEGNFPLIADQPEDALDTPFIFKYIVETLRAQKRTRQFIFTTRNANILVSADTEQIFVLGATADKGWINVSGSIDRFSTKDLVLLHMEGGEKAFELRRKKYGLERHV